MGMRLASLGSGRHTSKTEAQGAWVSVRMKSERKAVVTRGMLWFEGHVIDAVFTLWPDMVS